MTQTFYIFVGTILQLGVEVDVDALEITCFAPVAGRDR